MLTSYSPDQWKVLPGRRLEAGEVDLVPLVKLDVFPREIGAHDADQLDRREESWRRRRRGWRSRRADAVFRRRGLMESKAVEPTIRTLISF